VTVSKGPSSTLIYALPNGRIRIEAVVLDDGSCPAKEFLNGLSPNDTAKMKALFALFVERYPQRLSDQKFKRIEETEFFEFKSFKIRVPCFFAPDGRLLLTHGLIKKRDKLQPKEIEKARAIRAVFERKGRFHG
jgi:hypothetical protein